MYFIIFAQDPSSFPTFGCGRITRFDPQRYSTASVANMCCQPLLAVARAELQRACAAENLFCRPTAVRSVGVRSCHPDDQVIFYHICLHKKKKLLEKTVCSCSRRGIMSSRIILCIYV